LASFLDNLRYYQKIKFSAYLAQKNKSLYNCGVLNIYALSDLHLSFGNDKAMDIFGEKWRCHWQKIADNWNALVKPDDIVLVAGDISWAMRPPEAQQDLHWLTALSGKKVLIRGNHDYWWNTMSKMNAFLKENSFSSISILHNNAYFAEGIAIAGTRGWFYDDSAEADKKVIAREAGRLLCSIKEAEKLGGEPVFFLHSPPISSTQRCEELLEVINSHNIKRCYFGHLHGYVSPADSLIECDGVTYRLVSADKLSFCPKLISV